MNEDSIKVNQEYLLRTAIETYGSHLQEDMMIEEASELTKAILKTRRYPDSKEVIENVKEEMADVDIMLDQLKIIYGDVSEYKLAKLRRLRDRLAKDANCKAENLENLII